MKRRRITDWPEVHVFLDPQTLERIARAADRRALPISALIRETLDRAYRTEAR